MTIEEKYGNDEMFESWADVNIFFPIATKLVDPLYYIYLTPNCVTILSTMFTLGSIFFLNCNSNVCSFIFYINGYILDCVDGRMARKYNLCSDVGMALDPVSDNITNGLLFSYIIFNYPYNAKTIGIIIIFIFMTFMLSLSYGINEAVTSYKKYDNDKFYEHKLIYFEKKGYYLENKSNYLEKQLFSLFLLITKASYDTYRLIYTYYDDKQIKKHLKLLKHFGPGNFNLLVGIMLLFI